MHKEAVTHLFVPTKQDAAADIPPPRHAHTLVEILHESILCVRRECLDHTSDLSRFRCVQDRQ